MAITICDNGRRIIIPECDEEDVLEERVARLEECCEKVQAKIPPEVTDADDGKVLMVVDGAWTAAELPDGTNIEY